MDTGASGALGAATSMKSSSEDDDTAAQQRRREEAVLSRLPLPRTALPQSPSPSTPPPKPPTIRILAVADVDLRSAARLAEYALKGREDIERTELRGTRHRPNRRRGSRARHQHRRNADDACESDYSEDTGSDSGADDHHDDLSVGAYEMRTRPLGGGSVDLCIACGPFVHYQSNNEVSSGGKIVTGLAGGDVDGLSSASCSCCSEVGSLTCEDDHDDLSNVEKAEEGEGEGDNNGDDDSSSSGSSTSSGAGGYDNTGGYGYQECSGERTSIAELSAALVACRTRGSANGNGSTNSSGAANGGNVRRYNSRASDNAGNAHTYHGRRTNRSTPHVPDQPHMCDRHYRRMRYGGANDDGGSASNRAFAFRPELDASHEGVITSTLAQLENIVCRVLYVPGQGDPPSLFGRTSDAEVESAAPSMEKHDAAASRDRFAGRSVAMMEDSTTTLAGDTDPLSLHRDSLQTARARNMPRSVGAISRQFGALTGVAATNGASANDSSNIPPSSSEQPPKEAIEKCPEESDSSCGDLVTEAEITPHKRLTPNSRNVHRRWVQLGPGLGVAGLARDIGRHTTSIPTTIEFDQGRYARTLDALLSLAPPSKNTALFSSSLLATKPSQAIVLTNLPGDNERNNIPCKRRGKRDKEDSLKLLHVPADSDVVDNNDVGKGNGKKRSIPAAYRDLLSMSTGGDNHRQESDNSQVLLKLASPPLQSRRRSRRRRLEEVENANQPRVFESDGVKLVMPGSLRKSGDYALIDVALVRDDQSTTTTTTGTSPPRGRGSALGQQPRGRRLSPPSYRWSVDRVQFRSIGV